MSPDDGDHGDDGEGWGLTVMLMVKVVSIWRNIISFCDCARVLFPLAKVKQ